MSKILITGATGFVGRNLVESLPKDKLILFKRGDDPKRLTEARPDVIVHLAAELKDRGKMANTNMALTVDLLKASKRFSLKTFIYLGSSSEYGIKYKPMKENDISLPANFYGHTKLLATMFCREGARLYKKNIIILRPFSIYGKYEREERFIPKLIKACLTGEEFDLWEGSHDWVNVKDVVRAIKFFSKKELPGEIINVGTGKMTSNEEVVRLVEKICKKKVKIRNRYPPKPEESPVWVADISKAKSLGWKPTISLEKGLRRIISDLR